MSRIVRSGARFRGAVLGAMSALALAGCPEPTVVRLVDGREVAGRFVSDRAYALYAAGAEAEARGEPETALRFFDAAVRDDEESVELWTRIGAVSCRLGGAAGAQAADAFALAEARDAEYEPLWRERAACDLATGRTERALVAARKATELDPDRDETLLLYARALQRAGRTEQARRELVAMTIRHPSSGTAWAALEEHAIETGAPELAAHAGRMLRELRPSRAAKIERDVPALAPLVEVDGALVARDLATARRRAKAARMPPAELAVRAAALGLGSLAREQAELVLAADPGSGSARVALAVAADLLEDEQALASALRGVPPPGDPSLVAPSELARLLMAELLARRSGPEAASTWLGAPPRGDADGRDALLTLTRSRLGKRLSPQTH